MQPVPIIPAGLPSPDPDALRHSERVAGFIHEQIETAGGRISFGDYMQHALYAPALGYYAAGAVKFGAQGDFVTAPEVSPLFGRVLAGQCAPTLDALADSVVLELGAGSGALAVSLLTRLAELDALPARYLILDVSADLTERQHRRIAESLPDIPTSVEWVDALPERFNGVVLANEVADALPVERFERNAGHVLQQFVASADSGFRYEWLEAGSAVAAAVDEIEGALGRSLSAGFRSEVSLGLAGWIQDILRSLNEGIVLLFDYGLPRREYYAQERGQGWLRCHFRHHAHNEALIYPGIQDITAWVDFSAVTLAASQCGAAVDGFVTQAMFLLNGGLDNEFAEFGVQSTAEQLETARQVKLLTLPTEMGENFKCLGLSKGEVPTPDTFTHGDRAHTL